VFLKILIAKSLVNTPPNHIEHLQIIYFICRKRYLRKRPLFWYIFLNFWPKSRPFWKLPVFSKKIDSFLQNSPKQKIFCMDNRNRLDSKFNFLSIRIYQIYFISISYFVILYIKSKFLHQRLLLKFSVDKIFVKIVYIMY